MRGVIILLVLLAAPAFAGPKTARDYYNSATSHYNLSEWQPALDDFREAYRLKPDSAFLFNIAQCQRQLGNYREAANSYRAYRREGGTNNVDRLIDEMDKAAEQQRLREEAAERERQAKAPPTNLEAPPSTTTTTTTSANNELTATAPPHEKPLVKRPWFWVGIGAAVVAVGLGVGLGVGLSSGGSHDPTAPSIGVIR